MRFRPIHAIALLFTIQALMMAWFVTPLADLPDESGHYAYVIDMTKGRPLPVLGRPADGKGEIPANLWKDYGAEDHHRLNYIVQHPPLYYFVASIPYRITKHFTLDKAVLAKSARIVSALSLGVLVLSMFLAIRATGVNELIATASAMLMGLIPMTMHLSSGVSNDMFLTAVCSVATLYLVRFLMTGKLSDAYWCALWLAAAGATKMTAWVLLAAFVGLMVFELRQPLIRWVFHASGLTAIAFSSAAWWMHRNYYFFGNPFQVFGSHLTPVRPEYTWLQYLKEQPFFEWMFYHFYSLMGFSGYCLSAKDLDVIARLCKGSQMTRVEGISYQIFVAAAVVCVSVLLWVTAKAVWEARRSGEAPEGRPASMQAWTRRFLVSTRMAPLATWLIVACGMAVAAGGYAISYKLHWRVSFVYQGVEFLLILVAFLGLPIIALHRDVSTRVMAYGPILLVLFVTMVFIQGVKGFVLTGSPHGIQGRYVFPFVPLLTVSFAIAVARIRWNKPLLAVLCIALAWAFVNAYIDVIMPFYLLVRL